VQGSNRQCLAHYTHRVAISDHRLVSTADDIVTFRWNDYRNGGRHKLRTLEAEPALNNTILSAVRKLYNASTVPMYN
jgi:hypothetical protein